MAEEKNEELKQENKVEDTNMESELLKTKQSVVIIETDYNTRQTIYDYQTTIHFHE